MKLKIEIDFGNDAMQTGEDVASVLAKNMHVISESVGIVNASDEKWDEGKLLDVNGNTVGKWIIKNDEYELHVNQKNLQCS